jgi:hypothetical protein
MNLLIAFLNANVVLVSARGVMNLPLDEFTLIGKVVVFIICIIVLPLFGFCN